MKLPHNRASSSSAAFHPLFVRHDLERRDFLARAGRWSMLAALGVSGRLPFAERDRPVASIERVSQRMSLSLRVPDRSDDSLIYLKQIGVEDVLGYPFDLPSYAKTGVVDYDELVAMKQQVERHGLRLPSIHLDQGAIANLLFGRSGADEELDKLCATIGAMGRAGVPVLKYSLMVSRAILNRFGKELPGHSRLPQARGGAAIMNFDNERAQQVTEEPVGKISADEMWSRITRFVRRCVPVAEAAGVILVLHPDDPPVERFWGVNQVLNSLAGLERFVSLAPSPNSRLLLCQGTIQEARIDVLEYIRRFGPRGLIGHVELRGVRGTLPNYWEDFMDAGDLSMLKVIRTLKEVGYTGTLEVAHVPRLINDSNRRVVQAWSAAYLKALLDTVYEAA